MSNNKKKIITIGAVAIGVLTVVTIIILVLISIKKNDQEMKEKEAKVISDYDKFKGNVVLFTSVRDKVYSNIFNDLYYTTMTANHESWQVILTEYKDTVIKIEASSSSLEKNCFHIIYKNQKTNKLCNSFKKNNELIINYYVKDIKKYNNYINKYNDWVKNNPDYKALELFDLGKFKAYIDYNNDKIFSGK